MNICMAMYPKRMTELSVNYLENEITRSSIKYQNVEREYRIVLWFNVLFGTYEAMHDMRETGVDKNGSGCSTAPSDSLMCSV